MIGPTNGPPKSGKSNSNFGRVRVHMARKTAVVRALSPQMTRSFVATPRGACIAVQPWDHVVALFWPVPVLSGASVCACALASPKVDRELPVFVNYRMSCKPYEDDEASESSSSSSNFGIPSRESSRFDPRLAAKTVRMFMNTCSRSLFTVPAQI